MTLIIITKVLISLQIPALENLLGELLIHSPSFTSYLPGPQNVGIKGRSKHLLVPVCQGPKRAGPMGVGDIGKEIWYLSLSVELCAIVSLLLTYLMPVENI